MNIVDNPVWVFLSKCVDLVLLNLLWILFSLPVITVGASSAALYHSVHKTILHSEGYPLRTFWDSFRQNWKQGILLTLLCAVPAAFCAAAWLFAEDLGQGNPLGLLYRASALVVGLLSFSTAACAFPLLSRYYAGTGVLLKAAFTMSVARAGFTILLDVILAICILGIYLIPASVFLLPGAGAAAAERLLEPAFTKYIKE